MNGILGSQSLLLGAGGYPHSNMNLWQLTTMAYKPSVTQHCLPTLTLNMLLSFKRILLKFQVIKPDSYLKNI